MAWSATKRAAAPALAQGRRQVVGVIFDMDGTLFDSERIYYLTWKMAEERFGFTGSEKLLALTTGLRTADPVALYTDFFRDPQLAQKVYEFRMRENERLARQAVPGMKPGARELLTRLWDGGIPTALATSSPPSDVEKLFGAAGLALRFRAVVTGGEVARGKPNPDIFQEAARRLGLPATGCAVVEDSPNGVLAGAASGAFTVMVPDLIEPDEATRRAADAILPGLQRLCELPEFATITETIRSKEGQDAEL